MASRAGHILARSLLSEVDPSLTPAESLAVRAIAHHETKYGEAWPEGRGKGSFNMGAIMTGEPEGACGGFTHADSNPSRSFTGCFRVYDSPSSGYRDLIAVALLPNTRAAANRGSLGGVARAMYDNGYYTGVSKDPDTNIARYRDALTRSVTEITGNTGESNPFSRSLTGRAILGILLLVSVATQLRVRP